MPTSLSRAEHGGGRESARAGRGPAAQKRSPERPGGPAAAPPRLDPGVLESLQRSAGNAAVAAMVARSAASGDGAEREPGRGNAVRDVLRTPGRPLEGPLREEMEARLGADFSDVRVHTGAVAGRSARAVGARAYTSGSHVVIGDGGADKHTLAHELTHVVQQRQGPVAGTDRGDGLRVSDPSDRFERAAEANARRVMSGPVPVARAADETGAAASGCSGSAGAAGPAAAAGVRVQRLVGFEAELSLPSFGQGSLQGLNPVEGRQPDPVIGAFFNGGVPYGRRLLNEGNLSLLTDHNVLSRKAAAVHRVLAGLVGPDSVPAVGKPQQASLSNLEYVTAPFDEMAPGSDRAVQELAQQIEAHAQAMIGQNPQQRALQIPGTTQYATGLPLTELRAWLGPRLFADTALQAAISDFQSSVQWEFYVQATVGVVPSGLPSLYSFQGGVDHGSRRRPGNEHIADAWTHAARTVAASLGRLREIAPRLAGRPLEGGDQEALTGTLAMGLSYAIGTAMVEGGARGANSTTKNAVPLLLKLANLGALRQTSTTDTLRSFTIPDAQIKELAQWFHATFAETNTSFWQKMVASYPDDRAKPREPIYGHGESGVANTEQMLRSLLHGDTDFPVVAPGKALERPDEPSPVVAPYLGGQKAAPVEMRWISQRATGPGQLWPMFKTVLDEARKANLGGSGMPANEAQAVWQQAMDQGVAAAGAAGAPVGDMMDLA
ncbi:DUF4157 domain-containing protein [Streptomyces sp. NPDC014983]|uniref:eCIS core domain-containing protein n=1 Tax=Streptomyces sp. NPDC014983 TaxID=3364933 RepID=UPI0036FD075A